MRALRQKPMNTTKRRKSAPSQILQQWKSHLRLLSTLLPVQRHRRRTMLRRRAVHLPSRTVSYMMSHSANQFLMPSGIDKKTSATLEDNEYSSHSIDEEAFYEKQDEVAWELDEVEDQATTSLELEKSQSSEPSGVDALVQSFIVRHPQPATQHSFQPVPCPVILPQKRPGSRARGFVRAYSPVLQDAGLDQATFLDFLDTFEKSTRVCPRLKRRHVERSSQRLTF